MTEVIFLLDAHDLARHEVTSHSSGHRLFLLNNPSPLKKGNGGISGSLFFFVRSLLWSHCRGHSLRGRAAGSLTVLGKGHGSLPARVIPYGLRTILLPAQVVNA